jgi:UDP-N-acetylglucosamine 2-epimerase (non-hydrolysing)
MTALRLLYAYEGRADYARAEPVIRQLAGTGDVEQRLICAGTPSTDPRLVHFEAREVPASVIHLGLDSGTPDFRLGRLLIALGGLVGRFSPDAIVTAGGKESALAAALAGARAGLSTVRLDGGVRRGAGARAAVSRRIADQLAELLFVRDEPAAARLRDEGIDPDRIFPSGDPLDDYLLPRLGSGGAAEAPGPAGRGSVAGAPSHVLACLREGALEDPGGRFERLWARLAELAELEEGGLVVPLEPALKDRARRAGVAWGAGMRPIEPPRFRDLMLLIGGARLVVTDCDEVREEADLLGVPCLTDADLLADGAAEAILRGPPGSAPPGRAEAGSAPAGPGTGSGESAGAARRIAATILETVGSARPRSAGGGRS